VTGHNGIHVVFNSFEFLVFFVAVFWIYWFGLNANLKLQNALLLFASYAFYAWWDWRFLALLVGASAFTFGCAIVVERAVLDSTKRVLFIIGVAVILGILVWFKYFNFFVVGFEGLLAFLGIGTNTILIKVVLPLGVSYYVFRMLGYLIEVNRGNIEADRDWIVVFTFIAFFPTLVSGPIDRANTFIPQLRSKRVFQYDLAVDGLRQILWGLFKKVVIADGCAPITELIFSNSDRYSGSTLLLGSFLFTIQVYADFSGYSDMAIGVGRLLGFTVAKNFDFPFFAQSIPDFWRRWHMSLTKWLTDYLFTPLTIALRDFGKVGIAVSILITMVIVGLWHGANWTFVAFGFTYGLMYIPGVLTGSFNRRKRVSGLVPSVRQALEMLFTFSVLVLMIVLFRSVDISQAIQIYRQIFSFTIFSNPISFNGLGVMRLSVVIVIFLFIEWIQRDRAHGLDLSGVKSEKLRIVFYYVLIMAMIYLGEFGESKFLYFKF